MKHSFVSREIALKDVCLHPLNVRAASGSGYSESDIAPLAANIAECGLLQPLLVAPMPKGSKAAWGVLAGGRRLAALETLAQDTSVTGFSKSMKLPCRVVPETEAAQVTLSYSENALQLPMDALDRYEAFASMQTRDGADVARIARTFAITERSVKEALRLGNIHPGIRSAHRSGNLSLEALKGFDAPPDPEVQMAAFTALLENHSGGSIPHYAVAQYFRRRFVRIGDKLGQFVLQGYTAAGGVITVDLIEEDSVLEDAGLIETALRQELSDAAEARREALGLSWSEYMTEFDYDALSAYGNVYVQPRDIDAVQQATADKMALRMEEIEDLYDEADTETEWALRDEYDALSEQIDEITSGYTEEDAARSGVIAIWNGHSVVLREGLVRPEDRADIEANPQNGADVATTDIPVQDRWAAKLSADMAHVRTRAIALSLAQSPKLAQELADFTLIRSVLKDYPGYNDGTTIRAEVASRGPEASTGSLQALEEGFASLRSTLALDWLEADAEDAFAGFRALDTAARNQLRAFAVAQTLKPSLLAEQRDAVRAVVEREVLPNLRDVWTPDEAFLGRLTKAALLAILKDDLGMGANAEEMCKSKKSELVEFMAKLFAAPRATLTEDQRSRVVAWCPSAMQASPAQDGDANDCEIGGELQNAA
jgi:ParB family chromosome partitioning protein